MKTIEITNIYKNGFDDGANIEFVFSADGVQYKLKYTVRGFGELNKHPYEYRVDSFVTSFLLHAMRFGYNISSKYPMSRSLYYNITKHIIPQIHLCNKEQTTQIELCVPITDDGISGNYVGTGVSCGVDSFATIYEYTDLMPIEQYKLTHLFYMKVGAHDGQIGRYDGQVEQALFEQQLEKAKKLSEELKLPLIVIESNLNEVLSSLFGFTNYDQTHSIRNTGAVYLLQQYFKLYYYADAYSLDRFAINVRSTMGRYEKWLLPLLSNDRISFYSANEAMNRLEKTRLISDFPASYDNLLVCLTNGENCGECVKCIRTLVALDILGVLDLYKNSFNIHKYEENRDKFIKTVIRGRDKDYFFMEIYQYMISVGFPVSDYEEIPFRRVEKKHSSVDHIKQLGKRVLDFIQRFV